MRDKRYQHLRALVVQKASADVLHHREGLALEVVEVLIRVSRAPLLGKIQQLCRELLVRREVLRQELHIRTQRAEYLVLVLGKVDGLQKVSYKFLCGRIRCGLCHLAENVVELVTAEHSVLLLLVLDLLHKLLGLDVQRRRKVLQLSVKLGVAVDERLVQHLDIQQILQSLHRKGGILRDLHL